MSDWRKRNARALLRELQPHGWAAGVRVRNLAGEDLRGEVFPPDEDLSGVDLSGADLTGATLAGVDLRGADLSGSRLIGARLDRADLTGADLIGARLDGASLVGADLRSASIGSTSWRRARLTGAHLPAGVVLDAWGAALSGRAPVLQAGPGLGSVTAVAWHPAGEALVAVARGTRVELWDVGSGQVVAVLAGHAGSVWSVGFSADGERLASGGDGVVRVWDVAAGGLVRELAGHAGSVWSVGFSADGERLVSGGGADGVVRVWDVAAGGLVRELAGHTGSVWSVGFSADGERLASGGADGVVRIFPAAGVTSTASSWRRALQVLLRSRRRRADTVEAERIIELHAGGLASVAYSPDGATLAVGAEDGSVILVPIDGAADEPPLTRLFGLPDGGWAVLYGEHRYRLHGDPAGRFWWRSGLCRFEPGELDGYGVQRLPDQP